MKRFISYKAVLLLAAAAIVHMGSSIAMGADLDSVSVTAGIGGTCAGIIQGETFYKSTFNFDYVGAGRIMLSGLPDGTGNTYVDDRISIQVGHPDGTESIYKHDYSNGCNARRNELAPVDITNYFAVGSNQVTVRLKDKCGVCVGADTPIWITTQPVTTLRVEALIDGRSHMILRGNTVQWHHLDFAAPGRHVFRNEPTVVNGMAWLPLWPDGPDAENRFCNCVSDVFSDLQPPLPHSDMTIHLRTIQGRSTARIIQFPTSNNNFTLIIEFNDNPFGGPDVYIAEIDFIGSTGGNVQ